MSGSTSPATPGAPAGSNVVAPQQWWPGGNWPMNPIWPPPQRPGAVPPSCFSQLYALNQCYDDIAMMQQILAKVVCDLATNNKEFAQCLANGIAAAGASITPIVGVTDGSSAAPGIVGEWFYQQTTGPITGAAASTTMVSFTLQPGDCDVFAEIMCEVFVSSAQFALSPQPASMSDAMSAIIAVPGGVEAVYLSGPLSRLSTNVPVLLPFQCEFNTVGTPGGAGTFIFTLKARRVRWDDLPLLRPGRALLPAADHRAHRHLADHARPGVLRAQLARGPQPELSRAMAMAALVSACLVAAVMVVPALERGVQLRRCRELPVMLFAVQSRDGLRSEPFNQSHPLDLLLRPT